MKRRYTGHDEVRGSQSIWDIKQSAAADTRAKTVATKTLLWEAKQLSPRFVNIKTCKYFQAPLLASNLLVSPDLETGSISPSRDR